MCAVFELDTALRIFLCGHSRTWPARLHALSQKPWAFSIGHIAGQIVRSCIVCSSCAPADAPTRLHSGCTRLYPCHSDVGDGVMADHRPPQRRKLSEALTDRQGINHQTSPAAIPNRKESGSHRTARHNLGRMSHAFRRSARSRSILLSGSSSASSLGGSGITRRQRADTLRPSAAAQLWHWPK